MKNLASPITIERINTRLAVQGNGEDYNFVQMETEGWNF